MIALGVRFRTAAVVLCSLPLISRAALAGPAAGGEAAPARVVNRTYRVYYLEPRDLGPLVAQACSEAAESECSHQAAVPGQVLLSSTEEAQARFAALLKVRDVPPPTQVFHVHLFTADNDAQAAEKIPDALAPVLKDLASFLPFRSFHLISTGLVRTSRDGRIDLGSEPHFVVDLRFAGDPAGGKPLQIEQFELSRRQMVAGEGGAMQVANFDVLRTSFSMNVGETVVVGTSKLDGGDKALVVLLTAAK
jgi:hypothetical protein